MVDDAEARGLLAPGGTIVEATSGNTGVALALIAASRGYRCVVVMPEGYGAVKAKLMAAAGAEVVRTPADDEMAGAVARADRDRRAPLPAPGFPSSSPTPSIPKPTTRRPAPRSPSRSAAASTRGSPASGRPGRSSASRGTSPSGTPASSASPSSREGSILTGGVPGPARRRGHRPLADLADSRPEPDRRGRHGRRRAGLRDLPRPRARRGPVRRRLLRRGGRGRAPDRPAPRPRQDGRHAVSGRRGAVSGSGHLRRSKS